MIPLLPPDSFSLAHRSDYAAVGHPLFWLAVGWSHTLTYRVAPGAEPQDGSVIFPTSTFIADDLPGDFLTGSTVILDVKDAKFIAEILPASAAKPPYRDFRGDLRVYNAKSHDLYPIAGVSSFTRAIDWLQAPTHVVDEILVHLNNRVVFPVATRTFPNGH